MRFVHLYMDVPEMAFTIIDLEEVKQNYNRDRRVLTRFSNGDELALETNLLPLEMSAAPFEADPNATREQCEPINAVVKLKFDGSPP